MLVAEKGLSVDMEVLQQIIAFLKTQSTLEKCGQEFGAVARLCINYQIKF
jgi:hypothetical protein